MLVSRSAANDALRNALRLYVGRGRHYSVKQLSNGTGIKDRVIEAAMLPADDPDHRRLQPEAMFSLFTFLGADFTSQVLAIAGLGAFDLPTNEPDPGALAIANTDDNACIVRAAMDGVFDDDERKNLRTVGVRMVARGTQLAGLVRAA
ncbi:hypothetical protein [Novosphingobium sp. Leaf2]|uniref:hypothetical protein n=1 Tax=Novosphingobium sp. Leaf2 TaxID=1735670 RepID=UPI0006FBC114|nr:hypothetical protein [Novosphingobium sp. Leaf2]KQM18398.1 hypothetical protein ASE49_09310 [Novosphingobium sp. Leaf2]